MLLRVGQSADRPSRVHSLPSRVNEAGAAEALCSGMNIQDFRRPIYSSADSADSVDAFVEVYLSAHAKCLISFRYYFRTFDGHYVGNIFAKLINKSNLFSFRDYQWFLRLQMSQFV